MRFAAAYLAAGLLLPVWAAPAAAATDDPRGACAGAASAEPTARLVLGHFSGGRIFRMPDGVPMIAWRDEFQCFTSRRICDAWQSQMNVAYRNVEGYKTCLPLR
jgi:hypothetical protein